MGLTLIACGAPVPKPSPEQIRKELDPLWVDLLSSNEQIAARTALKLAARKLDAVAYIGEQLRPLKLTEASAKELIAKLASEDRSEADNSFNWDEIEELLKEDTTAGEDEFDPYKD